jgi:hypothetical protein
MDWAKHRVLIKRLQAIKDKVGGQMGELELMLAARFPLIYVVSAEEEPAEEVTFECS